jgi:hypothetical protein
MLKVGDYIVIPINKRRKWWQFWKPKYQAINQVHIIKVVSGGE